MIFNLAKIISFNDAVLLSDMQFVDKYSFTTLQPMSNLYFFIWTFASQL